MSRFKLTRTRLGAFTTIYPPAPASDAATLRHAVEAFGYLLPAGASATGPELAVLITLHHDNPKAKAVANTLERY